eukprot:m.46029 g.46029  ORF g.46029 m.46029 type:complete len:103 (-) comp8709_c0_seq1:188-496(-)
MGRKPAQEVYEEGDKIQAIFANNAFKQYFPGTIIRVHEVIPGVSRTHPFAEKQILFYYLCCIWVVYPKKKSYDIKYDDGRVEKQVPPELIADRPIVYRATSV